jgi:hypothetical protein
MTVAHTIRRFHLSPSITHYCREEITMRTNTFHVIAIGVVTILMLVVAPARTQEQKSVTNINEQLQSIEAYISKSRLQTERYYADRLSALKFRADKEIRQLEEAEKGKLAATGEMKKRQYFEDYGVILSDGLNSKEQIDATDKQIAARTKNIMANLELDIQYLEQQKNYDLTVRLPSLEAQLKDDLLTPRPEPLRGTVTGILLSKEKQLALINHEIVTTGDVLYGVKIIRILQDAVEFEKGGKVWKQGPGESPDNTGWQD